VRALLVAAAAAAVLLGVVALIVTLAIRALRRLVRAVWPHS
jgi:hypothetical protein